MLIGQQAAFLHPVFQKVVENLVLMKTDFGAVVSGSHPKLISSDRVTLAYLEIREAVVMHMQKDIEHFFDMESLVCSMQTQVR